MKSKKKDEIKRDPWKEAYMDLMQSVQFEVTAGTNMIENAMGRNMIFEVAELTACRDTSSFILELANEHLPKLAKNRREK